MSKSSSVHPVDEVLPTGRLAALGIQHVLVMYAGAIAVPLIVGRALKLPISRIVGCAVTRTETEESFAGQSEIKRHSRRAQRRLPERGNFRQRGLRRDLVQAPEKAAQDERADRQGVEMGLALAHHASSN